jgi:hypothetical protein
MILDEVKDIEQTETFLAAILAIISQRINDHAGG